MMIKDKTVLLLIIKRVKILDEEICALKSERELLLDALHESIVKKQVLRVVS